MVKFSKELEAQLIPEWKDAFVNYSQLKKHVKKIKLSRIPKHIPDISTIPDFGLSVFDSLRFLAKNISDRVRRYYAGNKTEMIIQVKSRVRDGEDDEEKNRNDDDDDDEEIYETELVQLFSEQDEVRIFFACLDEELNKVNRFYKTKEDEFLERGEILQKQLQILIDLKQVLNDWRKKTNLSPVASRNGSTGFLSQSSSFSEAHSGYTSETIDQEALSQADEVIATLEKNGVNFINAASRSRTRTKNGKPKVSMKIDIPANTPTRTISALTSMLWEDLVNNQKKDNPGEYINRKKIQCAEKMIRGAFVELYKGINLLKTYSSLNMKAFTKILKKFDKVANQQASASYLRVVKRSYFISSDKVVRLMDEVESLFTKHFANNDRKKAMKFLKPQQHKESHMVTFFVGLFTGSFVTLFSVYAILAHFCGMFSAKAESGYMETIYPVFSMFALLSLHLFMYGCNLLTWKNTRINYNFIFEFQPSTALKYRDAFLLCTCLMTSVVSAMVIHLVLLSNGFTPEQVDAIPGILLLIFMTLLICPFNIIYRSTRYCFLRVLRNIICSPFYKVILVDFFMADQLTSQIPLFRHMESTACYFIAGSFKTHQYETCKSGKKFKELAYFISFAPYYWRAMQCGRRWLEEKDISQLANLGKYVSAMVAAGARLTYASQPDHLWMAIVIITSALATIYQLYWDFVKDWGFFNPKSKNPWLRDELILKNKSIYYFSIALNLVLRVAWVETVMRFNNIGVVESRLLEFLLASLEVIRRGHWNFYRLENEHLTNAGKFRAVKNVPLPFRETDSDD